MPAKRRLRGFERAGNVRGDELGLPRARARALVLSVAWRRVAGEAIARRAYASSASRGVLEILVDDDPHWFETVRSLVPRLAGRLASTCPELGLRRVRLRRAGSTRAEPSEPLVPPTAECEDPAPEVADPATAPLDEPSPVTEPDRGPAERLERVIRRYLERTTAGRDA